LILTLFLFCASSWKNGNTKNLKINHFQTPAYKLSFSKIKHKCRLHIDKPVGHIIPILSPDFDFPLSEDEEKENEEIPEKDLSPTGAS